MCFCCEYRLKSGSDAGSVRFPVVAASPTLISLLELSVYTCFHLLYLFPTTYLNRFWYAIVDVLSFGRSVRAKFILVLESPQVGSLISSQEYTKSGRSPLFF